MPGPDFKKRRQKETPLCAPLLLLRLLRLLVMRLRILLAAHTLLSAGFAAFSLLLTAHTLLSAGFAAFSLLFFALFVPETSGMPLEEITPLFAEPRQLLRRNLASLTGKAS